MPPITRQEIPTIKRLTFTISLILLVNDDVDPQDLEFRLTGSGDPSRECDCSSLVQQAFRAAAIGLPRTTAEQVISGTFVASVKELEPGDLIFIPGSDGTPSNPRHVGLFIGDGLLVHSPETGRNVQIATVASWMSMISRIRRPT